ncbi:hypothetical protein RND71_043842 [Anisodus tanguticus]|uniref:Exportin-2 n=1 Tax=Anisodus tanguticus TaxID=243964 RepID=A0AAE1QRT6_9SOLA|nr:hypothetical protein RND71_043842 [Anisodus tanguticus]
MNLAASNVNNKGTLRTAYSSLVLCTKVYYSLNVQDLPEFFEDNLDIWMPNFLNILGIENKLLDSCSDDEPGLLEQVKSEICFIISMYAQKYHEEFETYLTPFVEAVWKLLSTCGQEPKFDILVSNSIKFLSTVANREQFRKIFEQPGVLNSLCSKVIIPNIEFRACDIELFEENGEDFIRSDLEGSDVDTRRKSACELVKALSKHFEEDIVRVFSEYIKLMLDSFASDPENHWKNKDAAIYLVTAICVKGSTAKHGTTQTTNLVNVVDFYNTFIKGDIDNNNDFDSFPVLRAGALKYIMTFRNQLPFEEIIIPILPTIIKHVSCPNSVIHTYAANTLEKIFSMKTPDRVNLINSGHISPIIEMLMTNLFGALTFPGSEENEYLMKAIMRTISVSGNAIIPYLTGILPQLSTKLMEVCKNPSKPYFNHYLFESIALSLQIAILHNPASASDIENVVFQLSESIFNQDVQEFLPYMLQLLSLLLEQDPNNFIPENYMKLLQGITGPQLWEKTGNIHPLVRFLKAYIRKSPQQVIESGRLDAILGVFQKLVASTANDHEGLDLLQCLFNELPIEALQKYIQEIYIILFTRLSSSKTPKFVKNLIVYFCFFMFRFGPQFLEDIVERIQSKMFGMVIEKLFLTECQKIPSVKDRKTVCVGLTKLITEAPSVIEGPYSCFWPRLLEVLIALFELPVEEDNLTEEVIQLGLEEDLGYQTTYSKLIFAPDPQKDIFQGNIPDARIFLAQCLHKLSVEKPGVMTDIISKSIDPNAIVHLKKYLDAANLTLS